MKTVHNAINAFWKSKTSRARHQSEMSQCPCIRNGVRWMGPKCADIAFSGGPDNAIK